MSALTFTLCTCNPPLIPPGLHFPTLLPGDLLDPCPWLFPWTPSSLAFAGLRCSRVPSMSPLPACSLGWKAGIFPSIHPSVRSSVRPSIHPPQAQEQAPCHDNALFVTTGTRSLPFLHGDWHLRGPCPAEISHSCSLKLAIPGSNHSFGMANSNLHCSVCPGTKSWLLFGLGHIQTKWVYGEHSLRLEMSWVC